MDMAVGIIIGAAFGKIVSSLVKDVIMPPIGLAMGKVDFSNMFITLSGQGQPTLAAAQAAGAVTLNYGIFINTLIEFVIVAFAVFMLVKWVNKLKRETPPPAPNVKECPYCISSIPLKAVKCAHCGSSLK
jgi:large conductance mechanosensitive channel